MKIGIIIGSIRQGRKGEAVGKWVLEQAQNHGGADFTLIDLKAFDLPLLEAPVVPGAANRQYDSENVRRWSAAIDECDGFVFITPEYNHSVPGAFKNAVDSIGPEWMGKAVAFVSYGASNGVRAVEHWRQIVSNFQMIDARGQVELSNFTEFDADGNVTPAAHREIDANTMFDQLIRATKQSKAN